MSCRVSKALVAFLVVAAGVHARADGGVFVLSPGSEIDYLPTPWVSSIWTCDGETFGRCRFPTSGEIRLTEDLLAGEASIESARLEFNAQVTYDGELRPDFLEETERWLSRWLEGRRLLLAEDRGTSRLYESLNRSGSPIFFVEVTEEEVSLEGAYNNTFADGDGATFRLTGTAVPEPAAGVLLGMLLALTRSHTLRRSRAPSDR